MAEADNHLEVSQVRQNKNHGRRTAALDHDLPPVFRRQKNPADLSEMQDQDGKRDYFHGLREGKQ